MNFSYIFILTIVASIIMVIIIFPSPILLWCGGGGREYRQILEFLLFSMEALFSGSSTQTKPVREVPGHQEVKPTRERASPACLSAGDGGAAGEWQGWHPLSTPCFLSRWSSASRQAEHGLHRPR